MLATKQRRRITKYHPISGYNMLQQIMPRDYHFDFSSMAKKWLNNNLYTTHMFNSPSIGVPYIEGLVNFAVKQALPKISDKQMLEECLNFVTQETSHSREHIKYNRQLNQLGYHADNIANNIKKKLIHFKKKSSLLTVLAMAAAFENLAGAVSITVFEDNILEHADPMIKDFWEWHLMEELEHKTIVFDLYQHLGGGYLRRILIYTITMIYYCYYSLKIYLSFVKKDGGSKIKGFLFVSSRKSFFMKSLFRSLIFYKFKFHPNQILTSHLMSNC
jgi:predicted metal-dependent hydrolase